MRILLLALIAAAGLSAAEPSAAKAPPPPVGPNFAGRIAAKLEPTRSVIYKRIVDRELRLDLFLPAGWNAGDRRPAFVGIHGGGWTGGAPRVMYPYTAWAAEHGLVGISVQYRLYQPGGPVTVADCVRDGRSAIRYLRAHAAELGLDPERIIVSGASAGGHVAVGTALLEFDEPGESAAVSCRPAALVLFSPVIDTSAEGYGHAKAGALWRELSPRHQVRPGVPPTLLFHGTGDATTPFLGAKLFAEGMARAGNRCDLSVAEGAQHTYMFKDEALYAASQREIEAFLRSLGFWPQAAH